VAACAAEPPVTLANHLPPEPNLASEPLIEAFSYEAAARFTDHAAMDWQILHDCITCHTNGLYLATRFAAGTEAPAYQEARTFAADYLKGHVFPAEGDAKFEIPELWIWRDERLELHVFDEEAGDYREAAASVVPEGIDLAALAACPGLPSINQALREFRARAGV
jgi:hypothetical protein